MLAPLPAARAQAFAAQKIRCFGAVGEPFDPHLHEAMMQVAAPALADNTIGEVFKVGYMSDGLVIRPAQIAAVKNPSSPSNASNATPDS